MMCDVRIVNEVLLDAFRRRRRCEYCNRPTPEGCDPHHLFAKGMGGAWRLDVRINVIALCRCCHDCFHLGNILREDLLAVVCSREGRLQDDVLEEIHRLRRLPKEAPS